jgi:DNA-binding transcriptional regulator GbsR (MarR family)
VFFAFQVTVRNKQKANATKLQKFASDVGGPQNLQLYYLVPPKTFEIFSTNPVNPVKDIKFLIQQDIDQTEKDMKELQQQNNGETDDKCVVQLQEKLIQLQNELNATWSIYCAMIKNPNESYDAYIAKIKIAT